MTTTPLRAHAWRRVRRLLAVRLDNLGDVLMATPALAALRRGLPAAHITLLGSPPAEALRGHLDAVDEIIGAAVPWMPAREPAADTLELVCRLAAERYDAAVVFTTCTQSALPAALACTMAGIPLRLAHSRENAYGLLSDRVAETDRVEDGMRHEVARQLALVASVGFTTGDTRLRFRVRDSDRAATRERLRGLAIDGPYAVVHPGASAASRRYPVESFAAALRQVASRHDLHWVIAGQGDDAPLVAGLEASLPPSVRRTVVAGSTLGELAALLEGARVVVANNSGPMHLAAAVGTPIVVAYALTNPQHTPWGVPARVLSHAVDCRHCLKSSCPEGHHRCLVCVRPDEVAAAASSLLALESGAARGATGPSIAESAPARPPSARSLLQT